MTVLKYKSLTEVLAEQLRESIIIGEFPPGMHLTETEIAEQMGVSRVVVREAMFILVHEGLLVKKPNKYTSVVELTTKDIKEIFDMRIAIEQAAARACIGKPKFIKEIGRRCDAIKELSSKKNTSLVDLIKADMALHTYMVESSNNSRMINVWKELYGLMLLLLYRYVEKPDIKLSLSHDEIVRGFEDGDIAQICEVIYSHIEDTKKELINSA